MKIFVCLIKQAHLLAIISKFGGGVDNSILWLSFAQQKLLPYPSNFFGCLMKKLCTVPEKMESALMTDRAFSGTTLHGASTSELGQIL
jgi:hypothetical protein